MVGDAAKQLQLMQKSLTEMNLKLQHVFSDIDGMSAQAIIVTILAGERDPKKLAALRDKRCSCMNRSDSIFTNWKSGSKGSFHQRAGLSPAV